MCRDLSMLHLSYCDTTQDTGLAQQCHCLAFRIAVCCNQQEKKKSNVGVLFLVPGTGVWEQGWSRGLDLGEKRVSRRSRWSQGAWVWDWVWAGLLCNVNPWGIRSCNRRGEVAARSLGMLTLCIPPP